MNSPKFPDYPHFSNEKITLRGITDDDLSDLMEICFYDGKQAQSISEAKEMQAKIDMDYKNGNSFHWVIIDKESNNILGTCGYYRGFDQASGELGCVLLPQFRGKGWMKMALQLAIDFGLNEIQLKHIWAGTGKQNIPAIKLLEGLGFIKTADLEEDGVKFELKQK